MILDAINAKVEVLVFREGVLSAVGHDLLLRAASVGGVLQPDLGGLSLHASHLEVVTALRDGRPLPDAFSDSDVRKIERSIREEVLEERAHPIVELESRAIDPAGTFTGALSLHGVTREVSGTWKRDGGRVDGELVVDQPSFGIRPFTAMFGALKVRREVTVRLTLLLS